MSLSDAITARRASHGATTVVIIEQRRHDGRFDLISAVVTQPGRGFEALHRVAGVAAALRDELVAAATPAETEWVPWESGAARTLFARALLMTRIAQRPVPAWLTTPSDALGDLEATARTLDDVYHCARCDAALDPALQIALARARGVGALVLGCPACAGAAHASMSAVDPAVAHAWLAYFAGDPRRALVHAARAEGRRVPAEQLDGVRGAALLALVNPVEATPHLRRAVDVAPGDRWLHARLVESLTRAGHLASATVELDHLSRLRPELGPHAGAVRRAIAGVLDRGLDQGRGRHLEGALEAFGAAC